MTRALAPLVSSGVALLLAPEPVAARRVVHVPTMTELCPGHADWAKVEQCIRRHGNATLERDERDAKLVRVAATSPFAGLLLYVRDRGWKIRGELRLFHAYELLGFQRRRFGEHGAYVVELGGTHRTAALVGHDTAIEVTVRQKLTAVCLDDRTYCMQVMTTCDAMLRGRALFTFRGSLVYDQRELKVVGDRSHAGVPCAQSEVVLTDR